VHSHSSGQGEIASLRTDSTRSMTIGELPLYPTQAVVYIARHKTAREADRL
jgi:hypothetical protein